jgi:hypothetical protein
MNCIIYMVSYNSTIHATCSLTLALYKYSELQMSYATQKLNYKANCKKIKFHNEYIYIMTEKISVNGFLNESKNNVVYVK